MKHAKRVSRKSARANAIDSMVVTGANVYTKYVVGVALALVCAALSPVSLVVAHAQNAAVAPTVATIRAALERARFEEAASLAQAFLAEPHVNARDRNDALELLAIVQIAQRNTVQAGTTLKLLFERDPEHPRRVQDPGPAVDGAFARARRAAVTPVMVTLTAQARRDGYGRDVLDVDVGGDASAVDSLHIFVRGARDANFSELVQIPSVDDRATAILPAFPLGAANYHWFVEARAPSGILLARLADASTPQVHAYDPAQPAQIATCQAAREPPLVERWWLWTSVSIVVAGAAVSGAVAAQ